MSNFSKSVARLFCLVVLGFGVAACTSEVQEDPGAAAGGQEQGDADHSHADGDHDHAHEEGGAEGTDEGK